MLVGTTTPLCCVCYSTLGSQGGPATLPCGHSACVACLSLVLRDGSSSGGGGSAPSSAAAATASFARGSPPSSAPCPLCRAPFSAVPPPNHELRELVGLAAALAAPRCLDDDGDGGDRGDSSDSGGSGEENSERWTDVSRPGQILGRRRSREKKENDNDDGEDEDEKSSSSSSPLALAAFPLPRQQQNLSPSSPPLHRVTVGAVRAGEVLAKSSPSRRDSSTSESVSFFFVCF